MSNKYAAFRLINASEALQIYAVILKHFKDFQGSSDNLLGDFHSFLYYVVAETHVEYKFSLIMGGKLYGNNNGWYINFYQEDVDLQLSKKITGANLEIKEILENTWQHMSTHKELKQINTSYQIRYALTDNGHKIDDDNAMLLCCNKCAYQDYRWKIIDNSLVCQDCAKDIELEKENNE